MGMMFPPHFLSHLSDEQVFWDAMRFYLTFSWVYDRYRPNSFSSEYFLSRFPAALHNGGGPRIVVSTAVFHARVRGSVFGLGGLKETKMFLPHPRVKLNIVGSLRDQEVACSASDRQGSNFASCV